MVRRKKIQFPVGSLVLVPTQDEIISKTKARIKFLKPRVGKRPTLATRNPYQVLDSAKEIDTAHLVGLRKEVKALKKIDPNTPYEVVLTSSKAISIEVGGVFVTVPTKGIKRYET